MEMPGVRGLKMEGGEVEAKRGNVERNNQH